MINTLFSQLFIGLIKAYRLTFSSIMGRQCRFLPTCSEYGIEAIRKYGAFKGGAMAVKRIARCHPFEKLGGKSGFDPVP
jgi:putative membrane protein insertion efficiency factor